MAGKHQYKASNKKTRDKAQRKWRRADKQALHTHTPMSGGGPQPRGKAKGKSYSEFAREKRGDGSGGVGTPRIEIPEDITT